MAERTISRRNEPQRNRGHCLPTPILLISGSIKARVPAPAKQRYRLFAAVADAPCPGYRSTIKVCAMLNMLVTVKPTAATTHVSQARQLGVGQEDQKKLTEKLHDQGGREVHPIIDEPAVGDARAHESDEIVGCGVHNS